MVLRIMIWSVPLVVIYNGLRQTLLAAAISRPIFLTTLFGAVVHGILSWLLIPGWGLRGAAVANLSGFVVLVFSMVVFVRYTLKRIPMGPDLLGPVAATAVSYAALIASGNWPWPAQLAFFAVAYGATALLTGSISRDELKALVAMVPGVRNRRDRAGDE
jgi:O-antigen/teichoic acid export membrane protein